MVRIEEEVIDAINSHGTSLSELNLTNDAEYGCRICRNDRDVCSVEELGYLMYQLEKLREWIKEETGVDFGDFDLF